VGTAATIVLRVLGISPIREADNRRGVRYYLDKVANSRDDYYAGRAEAPGLWMGGGSGRLGLRGTVCADAYLAVMEGRSPGDGGRLVERRGPRRVAGWSLTFSAPKSVSLLWAFGGSGVAEAVRVAHDRAVAETMAFLEGEAARARRGRGGRTLHDVEGLVAAGFRHRTSRAGDPQLHTHVIVANLVRSVDDGRWSGLDSRGFYDLSAAGGAVYQSALRAGLAPLGLRWAVRANGLGEVADIDPRLLRAFSTQSRRIRHELARAGEASARAAEVAAYRVRPSKDQALAGAGDDQLRIRWGQHLSGLTVSGHPADVGDVVRALGREKRGATGRSEEDDALAVLAGADPAAEDERRPCRLLTERASTLSRAQVIRSVATAMDQSPERVLDAVERLLARPEVAPLRGAPGSGSRPERRRYSTADLLKLEEALADGALARRGEGAGRLPAALAASVGDTNDELSDEQRVVLRRLLGSGDGVEVIIGPAGTGKTFLLAAARAAWEKAGFRVRGAALAALAAAQLEAGSGIPSGTVHRLLDDLARPESGALGPRDVLVVDEAGMVGSRTLAVLAERAGRAGAKLVLAGDHRQLPEIDAGGGFRLLAEVLDAAQLAENRRQRAGWERHALSELRAGSVAEAVAAYVEHGRVWLAPDRQNACAALIARWWELVESGVAHADVLLVAATRDEVDRLGWAAQARLIEAGRLGAVVARGEGGSFHIGDRVLLTRNHLGLGVSNGERGRVVSATEEGITVVVDGRDSSVCLPHWYVCAHLRQGYSVTAHRAQGMTVEWTLALVDDAWYRELGYSALSRARRGTELYLAGVEADDPFDHQPPEDPADPVTALAEHLQHSRGEEAALRARPQLPDLPSPAAARASWDERDQILTRPAAAPPSGNPAPAQGNPASRLAHLEAELRMRERLLGVRARFERPAWATNLLGPLPTSRTGEAAWISAAGAIAAYRERWQNPRDGREATTPARTAHLRRIQVAVTRLHDTVLTAASAKHAWAPPNLETSARPRRLARHL
jgi:conjugative relaxase-like TrwC/TraI family protein